ncbi:hypothetical protein AB1N83_014167, partial [Pleurotus pulmonarius]
PRLVPTWTCTSRG